MKSSMDTDPLVAKWVLEFLIRQPVEYRVLDCVLRSLPLPKGNLSLQKSLLLRKLDYQVSQGSISESTLNLMELLEEIEFRRGNSAVSDAMKQAYCAVAVDCILKVLVQEADDHVKKMYNFLATVKRLWRVKISRMEAVVEKGGLGSELLRAWKEDVEAAVWQDTAREGVLEKFKDVHAYEAVLVYLREEREKMGPSFLELLADRLRSENGLQKILGIDGLAAKGTPSSHVAAKVAKGTPSSHVDGVAAKGTPSHHGIAAKGTLSRHVDGVAAKGTPSSYHVDGVAAKGTPSYHVDGVAAKGTPSRHVDGVAAKETPSGHVDGVAAEETPSCHVDRAVNGGNASKEKHKGNNKCRNRHADVRQVRARIADSDETNTTKSSLANIAQVNNAREVLESSSMAPQSYVKDPLSKGLRVVEEISKLKQPAEDNIGEATRSKESRKCEKPAKDNNGGSMIFIVDAAGVVESSMKNVPKPSLIQPNSSACVYEWNDSIDASPEDVPEISVWLPSPKRVNTSPLKLYSMNNKVKKRRQHRKWSLEEEDTLRKGVEMYGRGWKEILIRFKESFDGRTEVDLKDKWRNMVR